MNKFVKHITSSNLWIALASICFYQVSLIQLGLGLNLNTTSLFIFYSSLFTYNLFQFVGQEKSAKKLELTTKLILIISAFGSFVSFFSLNYTSIVLFLLAGLLTFLYASPLFKIGKQDFSLRKFWFFKSITVAMVWTITCSIIPLLEYSASETQLYWFSLEKFLFILGITIPYDIKDLQKDKLQQGMTSFAMKFGVSNTIFVANIILFSALCLAYYLYPTFRLASVFIYSAAISINALTHENRSLKWYTFLVDGLIIFYLFFYLLFSRF